MFDFELWPQHKNMNETRPIQQRKFWRNPETDSLPKTVLTFMFLLVRSNNTEKFLI